MHNIRLNDIYQDQSVKTLDQNKLQTIGTDEKTIKQTENLPLRSINIDQPFYGSNDIKETALDTLNKRIGSGQTGLAMKNSMVLAASGMTKQDFSKIKEDGFSFEDTDEETFVTVAEKIRMQLAKAGVDVSKFGGVSDDAIEAVTGSIGSAKAIEKAVAEAGVPVDDDLAGRIDTALEKAGQISELTEDAKKFLINNQLSPTIDNVYRASFSVSEKYAYSNPGTNNLSMEDMEKLQPQIEEIIKKAGFSVNEDTIDSAKWLLNESLPLTPESLQLAADLNNPVILDKADLSKDLVVTVMEGKSPEDTFVLQGLSNAGKASAAVVKLSQITDEQIINGVNKKDPLTIASLYAQEKKVENDSFDRDSYEVVSARRQVEEIRLSMTFEVSISMQRRGISVDTTSLSELVEDLKVREQKLYENLLGNKEIISGAELEKRIEIFNQTNDSISSLKDYPASTLGKVIGTSAISITTLTIQGRSEFSRFKAAGDTYEALMTKPRADLGDSIKKAFGNVGDILKDLDFEATPANERAVRILGYNSLDITKESILEIRQEDEQLQNTFKNLTPGVVAKMIKEGINPLDLSLDELNEKIDEIKISNPATSNEEQFAEFLYKAEKSREINDNERAGFIGVYRLLHQVTESDGAVIGALLNQGREVTLRNMMTALRSAKHKNREFAVDDNFGGLEGFKRETLSITNQIEMAFQTQRARDAKDALTPHKLTMFEGEETYMNMSPDRLASALERMEEDDSQKDYNAMLHREMVQSIHSEESVYNALKQFDIPASPMNLQAMESFLADRNGVYRKVFSHAVSKEDLENIDFNKLMGDVFKSFGEAVKTPEDMANAQQKLAETATNIMRDMMVEKTVGYEDIQGMRIAMKQVQLLGKMGREAENYTIPIMVADESGTLNLKIVRGKNQENGLVDIAFNTETTGSVNATFKATANGITGSVSCVREEILKTLEGMKESLTDTMSKAVGLNVSIDYSLNQNLLEEQIYANKNPGFETTEEREDIATTRLYAMAKSFIDSLGNI